MLLGACFCIAFAPAGLMAMVALAAGFGAVSTGVTAFVLIMCMPLAAAVAAIVYEALAPQVAEAPTRAPPLARRAGRRAAHRQAHALRLRRRRT